MFWRKSQEAWSSHRGHAGGGRPGGRHGGRHRGRDGGREGARPGDDGAGRGPRGGRGLFGRGGGGGGRMFGPGDLRLVLLSLVAERAGHGYELIKQLEEKFGGAYSPSPGSIYPTLTLLEELGYLSSAQTEGSKRMYEITEAGREYLAANDAVLRGALARMDMAARAVAGDAPPADLHQAMHTLKTALALHRGAWDAEETKRVRQIIEDAANAIATRPEKA